MSDPFFSPAGRRCCLCRTVQPGTWNGTLKGFVCESCATIFAHTTPNDTVVGHPLKHLPSFSFEFEIARRGRTMPTSDLDRALVLVSYGFKRTYDGSVDIEYKSPIYCSLRAARKPLAVLDTLRDLVTDRCGTHLHVACQHKEVLTSLHGEIFAPLLTHLLQEPEETPRFWGRSFGTYATPFNRDRYHCFSLDSGHPTVEFRLARFRTAEQYRRVITFARAAVAYLDTMLGSREPRAWLQSEQTGEPGPGMLGEHVLSLYRTHVARMPKEADWWTLLSPLEQRMVQTLQLAATEPDEDDHDNEEDEDEESEDEWLL